MSRRNQLKYNETEKTEGTQCKKLQRLKEKEENRENNNKFMVLQKDTRQKWANISQVCSSDVEDYMVNQPEVDFLNLKHKKKRSCIVSPVSSKSTSTEGFNLLYDTDDISVEYSIIADPGDHLESLDKQTNVMKKKKFQIPTKGRKQCVETIKDETDDDDAEVSAIMKNNPNLSQDIANAATALMRISSAPHRSTEDADG